MKHKTINGLDVFMETSKITGYTKVWCSNGYKRVFIGYSQKEITNIVRVDNFGGVL